VAVMCVVVTEGCYVQVMSWSGGGNMPDCKVPSTEGKPGYVKLNWVKVLDKPSCGGKAGAGIYIVKINALRCTVEETVHFGTNSLSMYMNSLPHLTVIAGVTVDDATGVDVDSLEKIVVNVKDVNRRGSFAFVVQLNSKNGLENKVVDANESQKNPAYLPVHISGMSAKIRYRDKCTRQPADFCKHTVIIILIKVIVRPVCDAMFVYIGPPSYLFLCL